MSVKTRVNLLEELGRHRFDHAIFCTFNFQSEFFEGYCLTELKSLSSNANISVLMDRFEYESILNGDSRRWPRSANLRYLLQPIGVHGRFHPKICLLASSGRGFLSVGSANLTRAGLSHNAEMVGTFAFERGSHEEHINLFRSVLAFLQAVQDRWPSVELRSRLASVLADADWLIGPVGPHEPLFMHNLDEPLLGQIVRDLDEPIEEASILGPWFDEEPTLLDFLDRTLNPRATSIYTQNRYCTLTAAWPSHPSLSRRGSGIRFCTWEDAGRRQALHAKALAFKSRRRIRLACGSANFTRAGLQSTPANGNVEAVLLFDQLTKSNVDVDSFFDPGGSAASEELIVIPKDKPPPRPPRLLRLCEATIEGRLFCRLDGAVDTPPTAVLVFSDGKEMRLRLVPSGASWSASLDEDMEHRIAQGSTVVFVEAQVRGAAAVTNRLLVLYPQDLVTGGSAARGRRAREAELSAEAFASHLEDLIESERLEALLEFLTYCDIPLPSASGARTLARPQTNELASSALRSIGERNLRNYSSLHEAAVAFCRRHLNRLQREGRDPSQENVHGTMHVARSVVRVLKSQLVQLYAGLDSVGELGADGWYGHKARLDQYLLVYANLLEILVEEWLPNFIASYPRYKLGVEVGADLKVLKEDVEAFHSAQTNIDACRQGRLKVRVVTGQLVTPPVFDQNIVKPSNWIVWQAKTRGMERELLY